MTRLDPQRERFVREYHISGNASASYRIANPKSKKWKDNSVHVKASQMLAEDKVQLRLQELRAEASEQHGVTIETLTRELEEAREIAKAEKQAAAAVSATMGKAKLHGFIVDKKEVTKKRDAADFSDDELLEIARLGRSRASEAEGSAEEPDRVH